MFVLVTELIGNFWMRGDISFGSSKSSSLLSSTVLVLFVQAFGVPTSSIPRSVQARVVPFPELELAYRTVAENDPEWFTDIVLSTWEQEQLQKQQRPRRNNIHDNYKESNHTLLCFMDEKNSKWLELIRDFEQQKLQPGTVTTSVDPNNNNNKKEPNFEQVIDVDNNDQNYDNQSSSVLSTFPTTTTTTQDIQQNLDVDSSSSSADNEQNVVIDIDNDNNNDDQSSIITTYLTTPATYQNTELDKDADSTSSADYAQHLIDIDDRNHDNQSSTVTTFLTTLTTTQDTEQNKDVVSAPKDKNIDDNDIVKTMQPVDDNVAFIANDTNSSSAESSSSTIEPENNNQRPKFVVYKSTDPTSTRLYKKVSLDKLENLGYEEKDILVLEVDALDLIVRKEVAKPKGGIPLNWKRPKKVRNGNSPDSDKDNEGKIRILDAAEAVDFLSSNQLKKGNASKKKKKNVLQEKPAPLGDFMVEEPEGRSYRVDDDDGKRANTDSEREAEERRRLLRRRRRLAYQEDGQPKPIYTGREPSFGISERNAARLRQRKMDPPKPGFFWPDMETFRSLLREEAKLRLRILGDGGGIADMVKSECDWRLELYQSWLWTLHDGLGPPIVESRTDRAQRQRRLSSEIRRNEDIGGDDSNDSNSFSSFSSSSQPPSSSSKSPRRSKQNNGRKMVKD